MSKDKKRERNVNFSREETEILVSLVEAYRVIIEDKKSDAVTWQEKEKAWKAIETEFNIFGAGAFRDAKHLKLKYEAMKRDIRKRSSIAREAEHEAATLTPMEQKVKEIMSLPIEGGGSLLHDSDPLCPIRERKPLEKLAEGKLEIVALQKKIIVEELEEKILKKQMTIDELKHKNDLYELEKEHMMLKIELLKAELLNKQASYDMK